MAANDNKRKPNDATKGEDGLTHQQRRFVAEYAKDRNATQAAIRAGYKPGSAQQQGSRLMTNAVIKAAIDSQQAAMIAKVQADAGITLERTLREIARIAYFDPRKLFDGDGSPVPLTGLDDDTAAAIAGLEVVEEWEGSGEDRRLIGHVKKWKLADKVSALEKLMKHLGGYREDNEQQQQPLAKAIAGFVGQLHQANAGRMRFVARPSKP